MSKILSFGKGLSSHRMVLGHADNLENLDLQRPNKKKIINSHRPAQTILDGDALNDKILVRSKIESTCRRQHKYD